MNRWDDLPPTGAELWVYRHRAAVKVIGVLGVLAAVALASARLLFGEGTLAALMSLAAGAGFATILICVYAVQHAEEQRSRREADRGKV